MKLLTTLILAAMAAILPSAAQPPALRWMLAPLAGDTSCVWFRRTFVGTSRPRSATVSVATAGRFVLYVNGRNVSTSLYMPCRADGDTAAVAVDFDVTRFLRPDSNTIAVLSVPDGRTAGAPLAVGYSGVGRDGSRFAFSGHDGWLCRAAAVRLAPGGAETCDARLEAHPAAYGNLFMPEWMPACPASPPCGQSVAWIGMSAECLFGCPSVPYGIAADDAARLRAILRPRYSDAWGHAVAYDFSPGFYGLVRVTLRGCAPGDTITVGGLTYICSGEADEQAIVRFSPRYMRKVVVDGKSLDRSQVQEVEALCM